MKRMLALFLGTSGLGIADSTIPNSMTKLDLTPKLFLYDTAKSGDLVPTFQYPTRAGKLLVSVRKVSRMPIKEPPALVDQSMPMAEAGEAADYRMRVKESELQPAE